MRKQKKGLRFVDYSEKAFVVYGDSRHLSEIFKTRGGYFNTHLKEGAGWVFSKKRRKEIEDIVLEDSQSVIATDQDTLHESSDIFDRSGVSNTSSITEDGWLSLIKRMKCMPNGSYRAPHKAIFLLALIECISKNYIRDNRIYPSRIFVDTFQKLWGKFVPSEWPFNSNFYHPYVHLSSEPFYEIVKQSERAKFDINMSWTASSANKYIKYCLLDKELFGLLSNSSFANKAKALLIETFLNQGASSEPSTSRSMKYETGYLSDFHRYLRATPSKTGRPYSPSSINVYLGALKNRYIQSIIAPLTQNCTIDELSIADLERLSVQVKRDAVNDTISNSVSVAFNLYITFRKQALYN